ncbi:unnamed protein product, partial [Tetraodon nigroviridis]
FMDLLNLLSWACIVFTVGMFSTGLTDIKKMQQSKSVENIQFLPFLTTCLNNLGWLYYGILKSDQTLILVNVIGAVLQILYIVMYFGYATEKLQHVSTQGERLSSASLASPVACSPSACTCPHCPPWLEVVRSRNVQCLSFPLTVATLLTSASWVLYGLQVSDLYIVVRLTDLHRPFTTVPNVSFSFTNWKRLPLVHLFQVPNTPGIITSLIRFYLFWKF